MRFPECFLLGGHTSPFLAIVLKTLTRFSSVIDMSRREFRALLENIAS